MYRSILFILLLLCLFVLVSHTCAEPNFQEGMWEMTMSATVTGMDEQMSPMQARNCMTKQDLSPDKFHPEGDCNIKDVKVTGDTVAWGVHCKGDEGVLEGTGTMVYKGSTFEGSTHISGKDEDGKKIEIKTKITGKRIGPCK